MAKDLPQGKDIKIMAKGLFPLKILIVSTKVTKIIRTAKDLPQGKDIEILEVNFKKGRT